MMPIGVYCGHLLPIRIMTGKEVGTMNTKPKSHRVLAHDRSLCSRIPGLRVSRSSPAQPAAVTATVGLGYPRLRPHHPGSSGRYSASRVAGPSPPALERVGLRRHLLRLDRRRRVPRLLRRISREDRDAARSTPHRRRILGASPAIAHLERGRAASEERATRRFARRRQSARMSPLTVISVIVAASLDPEGEIAAHATIEFLRVTVTSS